MDQQQSLKSRTLIAIFWNAVQRYGAMLISLATNVVLVRLLSPDEFGIVGLMTVFVSVAGAIVDGGFGAALIQRKEISQSDYSTIFWSNLTVSLLLIAGLFVSAPAVSRYFHQDVLCKILRIESIILFVNAFCVIQTTRLTKFLQFRQLAVRTIVAAVVSSIVAVVLAFLGFGVWSLVVRDIMNAVVGAALLWSVSGWRPSWIFRWSSFKGLFKFGSFIFISSISNTLYINLQSFIIGRAFSTKDLGYYTQAKKLESVSVESTSSILSQVLFPVYASIADRREYHREVVRKNVRIITYLSFPLMMLLIVIAHPLLTILLGAEWAPSVPLFQILCIVGMMSPLNQANTEIFKAIGRSDIYLVLQTIKRIIGVVFILFSVRYGLYSMMWTIAAMSFVTYIMNLFFTHRYFGYKYRQQLSDIVPNMSLTLLTGFSVWQLLRMAALSNNWVSILISTVCFAGLYLGLSFLLRFDGPKLILNIIKR